MELSDFKQAMEEKTLNGLFVFHILGCRGCVMLQHKIDEYFGDDFKYQMVECWEDKEYFLSMGIDDMPTSIVYKDSEVVWNMSGVLFDTQLADLKRNLQ